MTERSARYACQQGTWYLCLAGDVRHPLGPALEALIDGALGTAGFVRFVIDLSEADAVDSTCLGILAKAAIGSSSGGHPVPLLISPREDITTTLRAICFDRLFELQERPVPMPGVWQELAEHTVDETRLTDTVLDAHRRLCAIDESNETAFRAVVDALERESRGPGRR